MWKFFLQKTDKRISYQELEKKNIEQVSAKYAKQPVWSNALWWLTSKCDVVLVLPGSVEIQLGCVVNFVNYFVEYSFMFPLVQKSIEIDL